MEAGTWDHIKEPAERLDLRTALAHIARAVRHMKNADILDRDTLKKYKILVLPLSLDGDGSLSPKFFAPYPPESLPEPTEAYVERRYLSTGNRRPSRCAWSIYLYLQSYLERLIVGLPKDRYQLSSFQIADYGFGELFQTDNPEFGSYRLAHIGDYSRPHIKCIMYNDLEGDNDHLLRGEMLTIFRLMLGQLKLKALVNDMIAPVLLFSLNGQRPRIIEAYFNGNELIVRRTATYDFTTMNAAGFKTFARWFIGEPQGDTSKAGLDKVHE